jgi:hypothetical protein
MSLMKFRPTAACFLALASLLGSGKPTFAQAEDPPEEGKFRTADGLRLSYLWYAGGKGQKSDCVMLVPKYGSDMSEAGWAALAKALQKQGYSVLLFDFRGHGKSADFKVMDKPDLFCKFSYNTLSGQRLNPKMITELKKEKFNPQYYPYLVNDLTAARRFLDDQNDASQCNSGRIFVVAEQSICPLVMLWISTEFARYGFGPKTKLDLPEQISAGEDLCGVIFLSWAGGGGAGQTATLATANKVMNDNVLGTDTVKIFSQIKKKVAMAFIYSKEDKPSANEAHSWFTRFGIAAGKTEDPELVKYIREVSGAEKLAGIQLYGINEKTKDEEKKVSYLESKIIEFFKITRAKAISGNNWKERKMENLDAIPVPLETWGLKR